MAYDSTSPTVLTAPLPLVCDDKYHPLDFPAITGKLDEEQISHVYVNVDSGFTVAPVDTSIDFNCPNCGSHFLGAIKVPGTGRLRIKMQREPFDGLPVDDTFYYDLFLHNGMSHLDSRALFEMAEKNRVTHWEYKVTGATSVVLSTRFVKNIVLLGQVNL